MNPNVMMQPPPPNVDGQRRLLSLDGGGIRGVLTLEVLRVIETMVKDELGEEAVLSDYFDYFAGASTGALIASCLARGWTIDELMDIYTTEGDKIFARVSMHKWLAILFRYKYASKELETLLTGRLGQSTVFGDQGFKSLLMVVLHNATTDSPWALSNNPAAKYNQLDRPDSNNLFPLWQVLRASTAAPLYFPAERVTVGSRDFVFVDGGITPYNNPAFQLYLAATQPGYRLQWEQGHDKMLLVSVGTGSAPNTAHGRSAKRMGALYTATNLPKTFMNGAAYQQDLACRAIGHCVAGSPVDRQLGALMTEEDGHSPADRAFTYARFDAALTAHGLSDIGLADMATPNTLKRLHKLDALENIDELREIGRRIGRSVVPAVFADFPASGP